MSQPIADNLNNSSNFSKPNEDPICLRMKTDKLLFYKNPNDQITATEMCKISTMSCRLCSAKPSHFSIRKVPEIDPNINEPLITNDYLFQRIIKSKKEDLTLKQSISKEFKLPKEKHFFLNLNDLKEKLYQDTSLSDNYFRQKRFVKSTISLNNSRKKFQNIKNLHADSLKIDDKCFSPPIIPLHQQRTSNNFFIN